MMSSSSEEVSSPTNLWRERLFNKDTSRFTGFIQSTTTHGVVRIFISKSYIRRLFWLVVVLAAAGGCLNNIIDRILFLSSGPTSTTVATERAETLYFPAVTICNLNRFKRSETAALLDGLEVVVSEVFYFSDEFETCQSGINNLSDYYDLESGSLEFISYVARHPLTELIEECQFNGKFCNISEDFTPVLTRLGVCYTFNAGQGSGEPMRTSQGTGVRFGLRLVVNINQSEYIVSTNLDAGVKVAIHPQSEPPQPDDQGIGVPVGTNAFISIRQKNITDNTRRNNCKSTSDVSQLNFVRGEHDYSVSACIEDCYYTSVATQCGCIEGRDQYTPDTQTFSALPDCTFENVCCEIQQIIAPQSCNCSQACQSTSFIVTNSYSTFPAEYAIQDILNEYNESEDYITPNYLSVNVYFETPNVETFTTNDAYSVIALLSDIGGQLGLFIGASVISVLEFVTWIIDEFKDRVFGVSEKKITKKLKCCMCCSCYHGNNEKVGVENHEPPEEQMQELKTKYV